MPKKKIGCLGWAGIIIGLLILLRFIMCIFSSFWSILGLILVIVAMVWMRQETKKNPEANTLKQKVLFVIGLLLVIIFSVICMFHDTSESKKAQDSASTPVTSGKVEEDKKKVEPQPEQKSEQKPEQQTQQKPEQQTQQKPEQQTQQKPEQQTQQNPEQQTQQKPEQQPQQQSEQKTDQQAQQPIQQQQPQQQAQQQPPDPVQVFYKNCAAVRAAGKAPLYRGQPGYAPHLDRDGDGIACE